MIAIVEVCSQGFDWVPTYMLPFRIPTMYGNVALSAAYAAVDDRRIISDGQTVCATFGAGQGFYTTAAVGGEWWMLPDAALTANIHVGWLGAEHTATGTVLPLVTGQTLRTEYVLSTSRIITGVQVAVKKRLFSRYGWASLGMGAVVFHWPSVRQYEQVVEPSWYMFSTIPPSRRVLIASSDGVGTTLQAMVVVAIGYDIPLRTGWYISPALEIAVPVTLDAPDFRLWRVGVILPVSVSLH
ncbi:MAG: hypothetical protein N2663_05845 [Chlorobi bacterium]|nr:hypothetical protein [Chlorobiota bacterium]